MDDILFFNSSDGWLLAACGKKATLREIIRAGDILNHAIFNLDEINNGLSRLESEGFIQFKNSTVTITNKAKQFKKRGLKGLFENSTEMLLRYCEIFKKTPLSHEISYKEYFSIDEYKNACK